MMSFLVECIHKYCRLLDCIRNCHRNALKFNMTISPHHILIKIRLLLTFTFTLRCAYVLFIHKLIRWTITTTEIIWKAFRFSIKGACANCCTRFSYYPTALTSCSNEVKQKKNRLYSKCHWSLCECVIYHFTHVGIDLLMCTPPAHLHIHQSNNSIQDRS